MAKILLGIALAVLIATATLGYLTHENAVKLQGVLKDTKQTLATTRTNLAKKIVELKDMTDDRDAKVAEIKKKEEEIAIQKGQLDEVNNKLKTALEDLEKKTAEVVKLNEEIAKLTNPGGRPGDPKVNIEDLVKQMAELKDNYIKAQIEVAEARVNFDALNKKKKEVEDKMAALEKENQERIKGIMKMGTSGRILAVNSGWNFVVLSIGDKQGAVINATMLVVRGGEPIAKVRISSVEPSTSIADILPGSVRRGLTVQPGDNVVFEGRNPTNAARPPAAAEGQPPLPQH